MLSPRTGRIFTPLNTVVKTGAKYDVVAKEVAVVFAMLISNVGMVPLPAKVTLNASEVMFPPAIPAAFNSAFVTMYCALF